MSMADFNQQVITEFRESDGRVGGMFERMPLLLLHHVGAKSGESRIAPLAYLADGDRYVIFASKGGAPENPGWYHNLLANPQTKIEVGGQEIAVVAYEADAAEREVLYNRQAELQPQFAEYQSKTTRKIPAVVLAPAS
jgi:deazaflavin-dependent oxidoreductase (nitroreductase family)